MSVVFDEPVPPKMPTVSPDFISKSISDNANCFAFSEYLKLTFSKRTAPFFTSFTPVSGERISDFCVSTSAIRRADSKDMVIITNTIENIIQQDKICIPYVINADNSVGVKAPLSVPDLIICVAPKKEIKTAAALIKKVIIGLLSARIFSAFVKSSRTSRAALPNFSCSCASLTNDLTTRIPPTFSCTELLSASYFLKMRRKKGITKRIIIIKHNANMGIITINIQASLALMVKLIMIAKINCNGTRIAIRKHI